MTISPQVITLIMAHIGTCFSLASGHSFLINPQADWLNNRQPECRIGKPDGPQFDHFPAMNCPGPCGETGLDPTRGWYFFSEEHGNTLLQRGQKMYMKWTKNNHKSGFVRFTLVPKSERMNKGVHEKFAFHYSCWEAGETGCDASDECGTDEQRLRYQTEVEIPRVFPDGDYVLGWAWYGGTKYADGSDKAEFGDYWSCANVKIRGSVDNDNKLAVEYAPAFIPGLNDKSKTTCKSAVNKLGMCPTEPCYARYEATWQVPAGFENGSTPPHIQSADLLAITGGNIEDLGSGADERAGENAPVVAIERVEVVNLLDNSVVTSDLSHEIDVTSFKQFLTLRAVVEPVEKVRAVEFISNGVTRKEGHAPYYIGGDNKGVPFPWVEKEVPFNQDLTLVVRATAVDGTVEESVFYPHFKSKF